MVYPTTMTLVSAGLTTRPKARSTFSEPKAVLHVKNGLQLSPLLSLLLSLLPSLLLSTLLSPQALLCLMLYLLRLLHLLSLLSLILMLLSERQAGRGRRLEPIPLPRPHALWK